MVKEIRPSNKALFLAVGLCVVLLAGRLTEQVLGLDSHSELQLMFQSAVVTTLGLLAYVVHRS